MLIIVDFLYTVWLNECVRNFVSKYNHDEHKNYSAPKAFNNFQNSHIYCVKFSLSLMIFVPIFPLGQMWGKRRDLLLKAWAPNMQYVSQ
jgi:hypothetical protein